MVNSIRFGEAKGRQFPQQFLPDVQKIIEEAIGLSAGDRRTHNFQLNNAKASSTGRNMVSRKLLPVPVGENTFRYRVFLNLDTKMYQYAVIDSNDSHSAKVAEQREAARLNHFIIKIMRDFNKSEIAKRIEARKQQATINAADKKLFKSKRLPKTSFS
jgi:hypothetical protein